MREYLLRLSAFLFAFALVSNSLAPRLAAAAGDTDLVDHRYYYLDSWTGAIGLPDDPFKSLVDADRTFWTEQGKNALRQGFYPLAAYESPIKVHVDLIGGTERADQHMYST